MSHSRWTRITNFSWPLLALAVLLSAPAVAGADEPSHISSGPASNEEAAILWKDGKSDFEHGLDEDAIPKLERFVARYPGYPDFYEARHILGQAYLHQREAAKAKPELKAFIQARGKTPQGLRARLELARANLELELFSEALLVAEEAIKLTGGAEQRELHGEALLLAAHAQIGLNQDARAQASLQSAEKAWPTPLLPRLLGETKSVALELKLRQCQRYPSPGKLEEGQVRDQLGRRGSCLLDALLTYRLVVGAEDAASTEESESLLLDAYQSYWNQCQHPPAPSPVHPKGRDAKQLKTYFRELAVVLEADCKLKIQQGADLLKSWTATASVGSADSLKKATLALERLK